MTHSDGLRQFSCGVCGHTYRERNMCGGCPVCAGNGRSGPNCTCPHIRVSLGIIRLRTGVNPECPEHGVVATSNDVEHKVQTSHTPNVKS